MTRKQQPDSFALRRLLTTLTLIPRAPKSKTVTTVIEDLERARMYHTLPDEPVTRRNVERDLQKLASAFDGLTCDKSTKPHRWFWALDAAAPAGVPMTAAQGLALSLAREHLKHLLPRTSMADLAPFFDQAKRALATSRFHDRWTEKIRVAGLGFHTKPPDIRDEIAAEVTEALLSEKQLLISYVKREPRDPKKGVSEPMNDARETKEHRVNPLGLVVRDGQVTLVCTSVATPDSPSKGPYQLHLHRMRSATCLTDGRRVPPGFKLREYRLAGEEGITGATPSLRIKLFLEPGARFFPEEWALPNQTVTNDPAGTVVEADVENTREFLAWLRGFGPTIKVLRPKFLREFFAEEARALAGYYSDET